MPALQRPGACAADERAGRADRTVVLLHLPVALAVARLREVRLPGGVPRRARFIPFVVIASVLLGHLSWKYIESPFAPDLALRFRRRRPVQATAVRPLRLRAFVAFSVICWAMGSWMYLFRWPAVPLLAAGHRAVQRYKNAGQVQGLPVAPRLRRGRRGSLCRLGRADAPVSFLMLGDSHGAPSPTAFEDGGNAWQSRRAVGL